MKTIIKTTLATLAVVVGASASQAETVWHTPFKGAPYATHTEPTRNVAVNEAKAKQTLHYVNVAKKAHASKALVAAQ